MPKIHLLDKAVAELIAAGEVVERPASIVKELVENAIDAGATAITIEIKNGGIRYIRIQDNGCGIDREDIPRAFIRHATSKVQSADDLIGIHTLGFRGEALASIAAMCRVELTTKTETESEGTTCRVEGGEIQDCLPAGCPTGTTILVKDVFFNTPARMKFLKKDLSEGNALTQIVDKCAMSHPEIAFRLIRDGQTKLRTTGSGELLAVIRAIYGKEFSDYMIPVDYTYNHCIRIRGYITKPQGAKPSRTYQNFFINGRYARIRTASAALEEAFKNKLMGGKYPCCVLDLGIAPDTVDVNVHPAKIEVRFADEKPVFQAVYFAVRTALHALQGPLDAPPRKPQQPINPLTMHLPTSKPIQQQLQPIPTVSAPSTSPQVPPLSSSFSKPLPLHNACLDIQVDDDPPTPYTSPPAVPPPPQPEPPAPADLQLIGELFHTYILIQQGDAFLLVDKHAAHERILYEQLQENIRYGNRQVLLSPRAVTLAKEEYDALIADIARVEKLGFCIEDFGDGTVLIRETPIELGEKDVDAILVEIAERIRKGNRDLTPEVLDRLYYSIACRSAVKGGDHNQPLELQEIVRRLQQNPEITHCPHGRPVAVRMHKHEIEKRFGRLG